MIDGRDIDFIRNTKQNGIEIYTNSNLTEAERRAIVKLGFLWHRTKYCFYAKYTKEREQGIKDIFGDDIEFIPDALFSTRKDILDDIKALADKYPDSIPTDELKALHSQHSAGIPNERAKAKVINRREVNAINHTLDSLMSVFDLKK